MVSIACTTAKHEPTRPFGFRTNMQQLGFIQCQPPAPPPSEMCNICTGSCNCGLNSTGGCDPRCTTTGRAPAAAAGYGARTRSNSQNSAREGLPAPGRRSNASSTSSEHVLALRLAILPVLLQDHSAHVATRTVSNGCPRGNGWERRRHALGRQGARGARAAVQPSARRGACSTAAREGRPRPTKGGCFSRAAAV